VVAGDAVSTKPNGRGESARSRKLALLDAAHGAEREPRKRLARENRPPAYMSGGRKQAKPDCGRPLDGSLVFRADPHTDHEPGSVA
jgi:hypothetical protein